MKRRIRRWGMGAAAGVLLAVIIAPTLAGRIVRWRLRAMTAAQLNADLRIGDLSYRFPYGVEVTDAALVAPGPDGKPLELLRMPRLDLRLARSPLRSGPLVIESIMIDRPTVHLVRTSSGLVGGRGLAKSEAEKGQEPRPWKLSEMFRLQKFVLNGGEIVYEDRSRAGTHPLAWKDLNVHLDAARESECAYAFHFVAGNQPIASLDATGSADLNSLLLRLDRCTLDVTVDPTHASSALPPEYQQVLAEFGIHGSLSLSTRATVPLHDLPHSTYDTTIHLADAKARAAGWKTSLEHVVATLHLTDGNGHPTVKLTSVDAITNQGEIRLNGTTLTCDPHGNGPLQIREIDLRGGEVSLIDRSEPGALPMAWKNLDLKISETAKSRATYSFEIGANSDPSTSVRAAGSADLESSVVLVDRCDLTVTGIDHNHATSPFPPGIQQTIEKLAANGSIAASIHGSIPIRDPVRSIAEIHLLPNSLSVHPPGIDKPIDQFAEAALTLKNGVLSGRHLRAAYGNDVWYVKQADVDLTGLPKQLRVVDADGAITFRAPRAKYPKVIEDILAPLDPAGPWFFSATAAVGVAPEMKTDYRVRGHTARGQLNLTDKRIPVYNINTEFTVTPATVDIERMEAGALQGNLKLSGKFYLPGTARYDLNGTLRGADLNDLMRYFTKPGEKPTPLGGHANLAVHVAGIIPDDDRPAIDFLTGNGEAEVKDGDFWRVPVMKGIADNANIRTVMTVGEAAAVFKIGNKVVHLDRAAASAPALGVEGHGDVAFDGRLNIDCITTVLGKWGEKFDVGDDGTVSRTVDQIQQTLNGVTQAAVMNIHVGGTPNHPAFEALPVPFIARPTVNFVRFLQGQGKPQSEQTQQNGGLLGYVKDQPAPPQQHQAAPAK